jgi:phospholipase C
MSRLSKNSRSPSPLLNTRPYLGFSAFPLQETESFDSSNIPTSTVRSTLDSRVAGLVNGFDVEPARTHKSYSLDFSGRRNSWRERPRRKRHKNRSATNYRLVIVISLTLMLAGCGGASTNSTTHKNPPPRTADLTVVNHIIYMMQENQSFDRYFGQINTYRQSRGLSPDVDVTPGNATELAYDHSASFTPFHMISMCTESLSSYWNESHNDWNHFAPTGARPLMNGYANSAGGNSRHSNPPGFDINGQRVMGYLDDSDLPYYYFMATQFAISDKWFSPLMSNTPSSRLYAMAATSQGVINKPLTQINVPTIFDELQKAGVTWKNYVPDYPNGSSLKPFPAFSKYLGTNIVPMSDYFTDLTNDTLPQVAFIDRDSKSGLDEHPGPGISVQKGSAYVKKIIDALMNSRAWQDSVFFLTYDEGGGFYDHVPPVQTVSPDGIAPLIGPNDTCAATTGPTCDFVYTGFRLPNLVVSPFAKAHYVDHTPMDTSAILTFIEKRFELKSLTKRDAAQPDISFFFDFGGTPNMTSPTPPPQPTNGPCYINSLP